jgi:hypothetical protein
MDNLSGFVEKHPRRLGSEYSVEVKSPHDILKWPWFWLGENFGRSLAFI